MIALGLLALFQMGLLPGLIVTHLARVRGAMSHALIAFPLSLLINFLAVFTLTALGAYRRPVVLVWFALELIVLLLLVRRGRSPALGPPADTVGRFFSEYLAGGRGGRARALAAVQVLAFAFALFSVLHALWIYGRQYDEIFTVWDAVVSWDRWAVDWAANRLPRTTSHYPQLLPATWSLSYLFLGTSEVKFFARWFMGAFEVLVPLTLFHVGWKTRRVGYFLGAALAAQLMWRLGSRASGYADSPVAYFTLVALVCLIVARDLADPGQRQRLVVLGGALAAAAAVTKQGGLWIALTYLPAALLLVPPRGPGAPSSAAWVSKILLIYAAVIAPWYVYKELAIRSSSDVSELAAVLHTVHEGRDPLQRVTFALGTLNERLRSGAIPGAVMGALLAALAGLACRERTYRVVVLLVILPFVLLWMVLWSYDHRNLMPVVPITALIAGVGLERVVRRMARVEPAPEVAPNDSWAPPAAQAKATRPARATALYWLIPVALVLLLLPTRVRDEDLLRAAREKQKRIGEPTLNALLYEYHERVGFSGSILTDYQILLALPEIGRHFMLGYTSESRFLDLAQRPEVGYALYSTRWSRPEVAAWFARNVEEGRIERIFQSEGWTLVTTCRGPCAEQP